MTIRHRYIIAAVIVSAVFFSGYVYAATRTAARSVGREGTGTATTACTCCGSGGAASSSVTSGEAVLDPDGGLQRIEVATGDGAWAPNEIVLEAGIPTEITFAEGQGCLARVVFPDLDLSADLTQGGATVRVPSLDPGEYTFSCGMRMVFGKLVVR